MEKNFSAVYCPKSEDHPDHKKILFVMDEDSIFTYCKVHGWLKVSFELGGQRVPLGKCALITQAMPKRFHFDLSEMPMVVMSDGGCNASN